MTKLLDTKTFSNPIWYFV